MVTTEALIGARIPDQSDGPLGGLQIANVARDLISYAVPRFGTATERNTAYANWVADGGEMTDGLCCTVSDSLQVYNGTRWVPQTPAHGTATFQTDSSGTALIAHGLGQVPSTAQVTPVFQSDGVSSLFKPMRAALTSSSIQVVCYRTDSVPHPRLLNTSVTVDWVAWP